MTEVDAAVIRRRLLAMRELLTHLESLGPINADNLRRDLGLRLQVSMAIAQLVQLAAEVNAHILRQTTGSAPRDLRAGFDDVARAGWIEPALACTLRDSPGMRNVIVHEYVDVDLTLVAEAVPTATRQFAEYVRQIAVRLPAT